MQTIVELIEKSCREFPGKAALRHKVADVWEEISYASLRATSDRIAAGLRKNGFKAGDHAAILAPSSPRWVIAYLGILKAGGIVIPIDKELKSIELCHLLTDCEASVLFTDLPYFETVHEMMGELPMLRLVAMLNPAPVTESGDSPGSGTSTRHLGRLRDLSANPADPDGESSAPEGLAGQQPGQQSGTTGTPFSRGTARLVRLITFEGLLQDTPLPAVSRQPADTAVILYTSGTTGRSKGAMLSHANIVSNINAAVAHLNLDETIHTLSFLPINHVFEQVCSVLLPLSLGGTVSFCESLKKVGENLAEVKPTFFCGVPALYRMLLDRIMKNVNARLLSRLLFSLDLTRPIITARVKKTFGSGTIFISGGAALDPAIAAGIEKLGLTLYQGYGITETSPIISAECAGRTQAGTVGPVLPGVQVRIDSPGEDMVGEILVRGPSIMQGYYKNPHATAEALEDGWYRTGDLGRLDTDGFLSICGRAKNLIVTPNGKNVYPEEVENELLKSPYIAETVVYGRKVAPVTEEIHALIYPNREALEAYAMKSGKGERELSSAEVESLIRVEVNAACAGLAIFKRVRHFTICWDEFPKTTTRKIKRYAVEAELLPGIAPLQTTSE